MSGRRLTPLLVGECPADWGQPFIDELTELLTNGFVGPSLPHQVDGPANGVRYLQGFNVRPNKLDISRATWVTKEFHKKNSKSQLKAGDLLVVQSGHIGTAAVVPKNAAGSNCHALIIVRFKPGSMNPSFVAQYLNSDIGQARLRGLEVGSSILHINTSELGKFRIPRPKIEEQDEIARIGETWDAAIEKTEKLIAAKDLGFQGMMQKLVMGGAWPLHPLCEFATRITRKNQGGGGLPLTISGRDGLVRQSDYYDKRIAAESTEQYTQIHRGEYAYNRSYSGGYPYGAIKRLNAYQEGVVSSLYLCFELKPNSVLLSDYFELFAEAGGFNRQIHQIAQEGARNHGLINVAATDFFAMKVPVPPSGHQLNSVKALSEARLEIELLRARRDRLLRQKMGLMKGLLEGRLRVNMPKSRAA